MREISRSGPDVENPGSRIEEREERFAGGSVHVRGGNRGAVAERLRGVGVGAARGVVRAVDLGEGVSGGKRSGTGKVVDARRAWLVLLVASESGHSC